MRIVAPDGWEAASGVRRSLSSTSEQCALLSGAPPRDADRGTPDQPRQPAAKQLVAESTDRPSRRSEGARADSERAHTVARTGAPVPQLQPPTIAPRLVPGSPALPFSTHPDRDSRACHYGLV